MECSTWPLKIVVLLTIIFLMIIVTVTVSLAVKVIYNLVFELLFLRNVSLLRSYLKIFNSFYDYDWQLKTKTWPRLDNYEHNNNDRMDMSYIVCNLNDNQWYRAYQKSINNNNDCNCCS